MVRCCEWHWSFRLRVRGRREAETDMEGNRLRMKAVRLS